MNVFKDMCEQAKIERISLEAKAQKEYLLGLLETEYENFDKSLEHLYASKGILSGLLETVGTIEKAHISEKVTHIDSYIR